jgi:hypothetical protein
MKQLSSNWMLAVAATAAVAMSATQRLHAEQFEKTKKVGGTTVHYKVVLPNGYDPATAYPGISWSLQRRRTVSCSSRTERASSRNFSR